MHIHWIANFVVPPPITLSGGDRIMVECIRRWSREHKVTVYGSEGARQLCDYMGLQGIEHVTWPSNRWHKFGRPILWLAQTIIGRRRIRDVTLAPDEKHLIVASSEFQPNGLPALDLKRRYPGVPLVACFFMFAPKWFSGQPGPGLMFTAYRPLQQYMLRRILKEAEMILTTSNEDRQTLIASNRSPDSVFTVLGGVDLTIPRSVPEPPTKKYDAVFIGRLHPQKGVMELLDIWKLLLGRKPDARLAVIGTGPLQERIMEKRAALGLQDHVELFGFRDGVEKYQIIKASRIVVHPAIYDSGGMAAAEALCCGLPGVSFDLPSLQSYYPRGWLKAPPNDYAGFAYRLSRLLAEPELYKQTSAEARAAGLEWDWDARAGSVLAAIERAISSNQDRSPE